MILLWTVLCLTCFNLMFHQGGNHEDYQTDWRRSFRQGNGLMRWWFHLDVVMGISTYVPLARRINLRPHSRIKTLKSNGCICVWHLQAFPYIFNSEIWWARFFSIGLPKQLNSSIFLCQLNVWNNEFIILEVRLRRVSIFCFFYCYLDQR